MYSIALLLKRGGEGRERKGKEGEGREGKGEKRKKEKKREKGNLKTKSPNNRYCEEYTLNYLIIYIDCI